jgi:hypothetical protein
VYERERLAYGSRITKCLFETARMDSGECLWDFFSAAANRYVLYMFRNYFVQGGRGQVAAPCSITRTPLGFVAKLFLSIDHDDTVCRNADVRSGQNNPTVRIIKIDADDLR